MVHYLQTVLDGLQTADFCRRIHLRSCFKEMQTITLVFKQFTADNLKDRRFF